MFIAHRFVKTIVTTFFGAFAAYAVATGLAGAEAHAQISGTIGGDLVGRPHLIEEEGDPLRGAAERRRAGHRRRGRERLVGRHQQHRHGRLQRHAREHP